MKSLINGYAHILYHLSQQELFADGKCNVNNVAVARIHKFPTSVDLSECYKLLLIF